MKSGNFLTSNQNNILLAAAAIGAVYIITKKKEAKKCPEPQKPLLETWQWSLIAVAAFALPWFTYAIVGRIHKIRENRRLNRVLSEW